MTQMTRRDLFRYPLVAIALALVPKWVWAMFPAQPKPDLRAIGFAIQENIGMMVFNPVAVQALSRPMRVDVPIFTLSANPQISLAEIKNRRIKITT